MKKQLLSFIITAILVCGYLPSFASLKGTYTINSSKSASATNYKTFGSAVSDMIYGTRADGGSANGSGISGSVVFNIADATYSEEISITSISGASFSKTITFQSASADSSKVILTYASSSSSSNNYTLDLDGAQHLIFKNITIQRSGSGYYSTVVNIHGGSHNNSFLNNMLTGVTTTQYLYTEETVVLSAKDKDTNNVFRNNLVQNGSLGFYLVGINGNPEPGTVIEGNTVKNAHFTQVYLKYQQRPVIQKNNLSTSNDICNAIYMYKCGSAQVIKNRIHLYGANCAIFSHHCTSPSTDPELVANNFMESGCGSTSDISAFTIYAWGGSYQQYYFNNVLSVCGSSSMQTVHIDSTDNVDFQNNNIINTGGGYTYHLIACTNFTSDYNNLYSSGTYLAYADGKDYTSLSGFTSATSLDNSSLSIDPKFVSSSDLHATNTKLSGKGKSISFISDDIDGKLRISSSPGIGANEFGASNDAGVVQNASFMVCGGRQAVKIDIKNYGTDSLISADIHWKLNGSSQPTYSWTGSLTKGAYDRNIILDTIKFISGKIYNLKIWSAYPNGVKDEDPTNDTAFYSFTAGSIPSINAGFDKSICFGEPDTIGSKSTLSGNTYDWRSIPSGFVSSASKNIVLPVSTTTYILTQTDTSGCFAIDSVIVTVNALPIAKWNYNVSGGSYSFFPLDTTFLSYLWSFGDGNVSSSKKPLHSYAANSSYKVSLNVEDKNHCKANYDSILSVRTIINDNSEKDISLSIFPNPFNSKIAIAFNIDRSTELNLTLYTLTGVPICTIFDKLIEPGNYQQTYNLKDYHLSKGVYILNISGEGFHISKRLILME
jgi:hypothetical protein